jgi:hypothetical protein
MLSSPFRPEACALILGRSDTTGTKDAVEERDRNILMTFGSHKYLLRRTRECRRDKFLVKTAAAAVALDPLDDSQRSP